ncbi:MAG: hypothetical protein KC588_13685 [Nitrospira sp.]|nr:hypothetical protein [Nitrospira sp.]
MKGLGEQATFFQADPSEDAVSHDTSFRDTGQAKILTKKEKNVTPKQIITVLEAVRADTLKRTFLSFYFLWGGCHVHV